MSQVAEAAAAVFGLVILGSFTVVTVAYAYDVARDVWKDKL